jgi:hypothetical protein
LVAVEAAALAPGADLGMQRQQKIGHRSIGPVDGEGPMQRSVSARISARCCAMRVV